MKFENRKNCVKIICFFLLILWMSIVFFFSNQPGKESSNTSNGVVAKIIEILPNVQNLPQKQKESLIKFWNPYLRKLAHFSIYAIGGCLFILTLKQVKNLKENKQILVSSILGILYAVSDEIHQYWIEGRSCKLTDVWIDSLGILTGILFIMILSKVKEKITK